MTPNTSKQYTAMRGNDGWDVLFESWRAKMDRLIEEHPLHIISWESTRRCNLNCVHCGSPSEDAVHEEELTTCEVINAFEEIATDFDMSHFRHVNITGGEPFVRSDLVQILESISQRPCYRNIDIQTNGLFLADHPQILPVLKRAGVAGIGVSIDGLAATHNDFRRTPHGFEKACATAIAAREESLVVTISTVAHADNIHELPELYDYAVRELKPRVFRVMIIDPLGRAELNDHYLLNSRQKNEVICFLQQAYSDTCASYSNPQTTMVELGCGGWLGKEVEGTIRPFIFHCIAGINNLGILYDGKLASCSNIPRDFIEGDLRKEIILDVWNTRYHRFRNREWCRTGVCKTCEDWKYCHGGPMHLHSISNNFKCHLPPNP